MGAEKFACVVALVVFGGGAVGLVLERLLPDEFTTGGPRDMIGAVVGLLTLLSALVLGLLIWTSYGVYSGQNLAVQTLAAKVLQLDFALTDYGPEAKGGRALLRQELAKTINAVWRADLSDRQFAASSFAAAINNLRHQDGLLKSLDPTTDEQKQALASARQTLEFDRPVAAANGVRALRRRFLPAGLCRRWLGGHAVLRLRPDVERQRDERRRARFRRPRGRQRHLSHS